MGDETHLQLGHRADSNPAGARPQVRHRRLDDLGSQIGRARKGSEADVSCKTCLDFQGLSQQSPENRW